MDIVRELGKGFISDDRGSGVKAPVVNAGLRDPSLNPFLATTRLAI